MDGERNELKLQELREYQAKLKDQRFANNVLRELHGEFPGYLEEVARIRNELILTMAQIKALQ